MSPFAAFNHCIEHGAGWSSELSTAVFAITAKLIEFDLELAKTSDPVLEGKLVACRLATFRQRVVSARKAIGEKKVCSPFSPVCLLERHVDHDVQTEEYRQLLAEADKLIKQLERSPASQSEKANELLAAAYALKVEAHAELDEWSSLVSLVDVREHALAHRRTEADFLAAGRRSFDISLADRGHQARRRPGDLDRLNLSCRRNVEDPPQDARDPLQQEGG